MALQNNVLHTTYVDNSDYESETLNFVLTCDAGYKFSSAPTFRYRSGETGLFVTVEGVLSDNDTIATFTGNNYYDDSEVIINCETAESSAPPTGTGTVTNNVPNSTDKSKWQPDTGYGAFWYLQLTANDGYKFSGDITAIYWSTDGTEKTITLRKRNDYNVWAYVYDSTETTDFTINGNTASDNELTVTNNVPNTTAKGEKTGSRSASVNLTANEGFTIQSARVNFTNGYGYPSSEEMTISHDGKTASWANDDCEPDRGVTIEGETVSEGAPELKVTNEIANTINETHTYDGVTATFTVEGEHYPSYRFIEPKVNYVGTDGQPHNVDMEVEVLSYYSVAKATITDIDPLQPITITGEYISVAHITSNLTNCTANPPLPEWIRYGETLTVNLVANENTEFKTDEMNIPTITYDNEVGYYQKVKLTVSDDKKTASGSLAITNDDWSKFAVNAEAFPITVVGQQYGAINVYLVTLDELAEFSAKRFFKETGTDPSTGAPVYENIDLGAYVNKIRRIYTNIGASSTDVIRCGNYNTGVSCQQPSEDKITLNFGTAQVPAHNEDNTDFESDLQVFLPFAGFVTLNRDYAGQTISLQYVINVVTGNGVALLSCNGVVFQVEEIEPSSEIIYLSPSTQVKTVGGDDWNEMLYYGLEPYIYCKWYESKSNGRNTDRQTGIVGDFRGFNIFDDVTPIHTAEMLTEEQEIIYTALSDGVYIE